MRTLQTKVCLALGVRLGFVVLVAITGQLVFGAQDLPPTALESFANRQDARTVWSRFVGRLTGERASVMVTALVIESPSAVPSRMSGIRIEPRHEGARPDCDLPYVEWMVMCGREWPAVYVETERLGMLKVSTANPVAAIQPGHPQALTRFRSSGGDGLLVFGYSIHGRVPEDFAALVSAAETLLANAPR